MSETTTCPTCGTPCERSYRESGRDIITDHIPLALDALDRAVVEATWHALIEYSQDPGNAQIDMTDWIAAGLAMIYENGGAELLAARASKEQGRG